MSEKIHELTQNKLKLLKKINELGDMRQGSISIRYQRCSKSPCVCDDPNHPGHGPIYSFSTNMKGKKEIRNYKLGSELNKLQEEVDNYKKFKELSRELIDVSYQICEQRPVKDICDVAELNAIKKKLQNHFKMKYKRRSKR